MTSTWQQISEACPRARWRRDTEVDSCEQPGCSVRFGYFGMPGLSWSTASASNRTTSASNAGIDTTSSSPFSRTASLSSLDSLSIKTSVDSCSPTKGSPADAISPSIIASSLFAPLRLVDSAINLPSTASSRVSEATSSVPPSICTTSANVNLAAGPAPPSTPTLVTSPGSSTFDATVDSGNISSGRRHSASSTFSLPRSPIKLHRRHHCRRCGSCFCSEHSSHTATLILASEDTALSTIDEQAKVVLQPDEPPITTSSLFTTANLFSSARLSSSPPSLTSSHYIRARVCDTCYTAVQKARTRLQDSPSPPQANFLSLTSGWSTPTIMEDDDEEEYFDSLERIRRESKREQHEALKVLCNDVTANRVVAKAVDGKPEAARQHSLPLVDCGQTLQSDFKLAMGPQLATATLWEKVELKRRNEEVAKRAMSVDSLVVDELEDEWNVDVQAVLSLSKQSIFDRRCSSRPPSPQPIRGTSAMSGSRRGSATADSTTSSNSSTSPLSCTLPGMARMGATRLQRSFDSSQRSIHAKPAFPPRRASRPADK